MQSEKELTISDPAYALKTLEQLSYYSLIGGYKDLFKHQYSTSDIRTKISSNFDNISEKQLHQLIRIIASCRNVCAHGKRLYSFHVKENIPNMPIHSKLGISIKNELYICGTSDLFVVVVSLRYLLDNNEFKIYKQQLTRLTKDIFADCPHLSQDLLFKEMGFPHNWKSITRYKI